MIIYNETIIVDEGIHHEWLNWVKSEHIPATIATGYFESFRILKVMDSPNEGVTYCIQYDARDVEKYNLFNLVHQRDLQAVHQQRFENMFVMFNSLMETVD